MKSTDVISSIIRRQIQKAHLLRLKPWNDLIAADFGSFLVDANDREQAKKVLLATSMGGFLHGSIVESSLAIALALRGARVEILLCDSFLPACQLTEIAGVSPSRLLKMQPQPRCHSCHSAAKRIFEPLGLRIHWLGELLTSDDLVVAKRIANEIPFGQIDSYRLKGMAIGEHSMAGALRYFARGDLEGERHGELVLRRYLEAGIQTALATEHLLDAGEFDVACFNHGLYVPQGVIGEVCRKSSLRVVNWNPAYKRHTFIFSHGDTYHHTMVSEPTQDWKNLEWDEDLELMTMGYLKSRWRGTEDWIWFHDRPIEDSRLIEVETGIDFSKPCIGLLTNVMWDAQLHYSSNAFSNMLEWVIETISYFEKRPDLQLIIRAHPAEIRGFVPSRQPIIVEILREFPNLPNNVHLIPPESQISTYALIERCNAILIYNTKTGIEVSSMGIPTIVAGEAWIRNKGFSLDADSPQEYFTLLDKLPLASGLDDDQLQLAKKYAFHFFFRRMIPLPFITQGKNGGFGLDLSTIEDLKSGNHLGLDVICDGILENQPFIYPAELQLT